MIQNRSANLSGEREMAEGTRGRAYAILAPLPASISMREDREIASSHRHLQSNLHEAEWIQCANDPSAG